MRCKIVVVASPTAARPGFDLSLDPFMSGFESQIELQDQNMRTLIKLLLMTVVFPLAKTNKLNASLEEDAKAVAALDSKYQAAVKTNDAQPMDQILADDFILVTGRGSVFSKADLIDSARKKEVNYERQDGKPGSGCGVTQPL
jgi:Domain of unknown function (DUF4440)